MSRRAIEKERDAGTITVLAPAVDVELQEGATAWAVAKPANLKKTHGIDITEKRLQEMADAYDPEGIEAAPLNFDHEPGGPAHGWVERAYVRDGMLWVEPGNLSAELVEGIKAGRYRRASIELTQDHPETGGWYLNGLAVLGNAKPAIKALPPLRLSESCHVLHTDSTPLPAPDSASDDTGGQPMADEKKAPQGGAVERSFRQWLQATFGGAKLSEEQEQKSAAMAPAKEGDEGATECPTCKGSGWVVETAEEKPAEAEAEPQKEDKAASAPDLQALVDAGIRKALAAKTVAADLAPFAGKVPPALLRKAKDSMLRAAADGRDEDYAAQLETLQAVNESDLLSGEIAGEEQSSSAKSAAMSERQTLYARHGITPEREAELKRRYSIQ